MDIDTPFPVRGTVEIDGDNATFSLPCISEWLSEGRTDYLQRAEDRVRREYGDDTEVRVIWKGEYGECTGLRVLGPVDEL